VSAGSGFVELGHHGGGDFFRHVLEDGRGQVADEGLAGPQTLPGPPVQQLHDLDGPGAGVSQDYAVRQVVAGQQERFAHRVRSLRRSADGLQHMAFLDAAREGMG
jgi:hypothetical protein